LGSSQPESDLILSPQHRIVIEAQDEETFVPASFLLSWRGVRKMNGARNVTYFAIMLKRHHVLFANGAKCESFYPGGQAFRSISAEAKREILNLCPELSSVKNTCSWPLARRSMKRTEFLNLTTSSRCDKNEPALQT
jgi:hypothetical protein